MRFNDVSDFTVRQPDNSLVEGHDPLRRACQVGHDEANARIKLAAVPLDLGHHPARFPPALRPIGEAGVVAAHLPAAADLPDA